MPQPNNCLVLMRSLSLQEREAITTRYRLEHERVRELEQLLACVRTQEHHLELESKVA